MTVSADDLFEVSQASEFLKEDQAFGEATGVQPYVSPAEVARLEGFGKQNPIKKADGTYVFPSDFEEWKVLMVDQINTAVAAVLLPATTAAEDARDESIVAKDGSVAAQALAIAARDLAQKWADEAYNVEVVAGLYSARHWAQEARNITSGARKYVGGLDASAGVLPIGAPVAADAGKYWRITVEGTLPVVGLAKVSEELAIRADLSYEILPAPDVVETFNGRTGDVVPTAADVGLENVDNFPSTSSLIDGSTSKFATAKAVYDLKIITDAISAAATNAQNDANTADGKAVAAQADANQALTDASTADGKAVTAQTTANQAVSDAANAQSTADGAIVAAVAASDLAATKQTSAEVDAKIAAHEGVANTHPTMVLSGNDLLITI